MPREGTGRTLSFQDNSASPRSSPHKAAHQSLQPQGSGQCLFTAFGAGHPIPQHTRMSAAMKIPGALSPGNIWPVSNHVGGMADSKG